MCEIEGTLKNKRAIGYKVAVQVINNKNEIRYLSPFTGVEYKKNSRVKFVTARNNNPVLPAGINRECAIPGGDNFKRDIRGYTNVILDLEDAKSFKRELYAYSANEVFRLVILKLSLSEIKNYPILNTKMKFNCKAYPTKAGAYIKNMILVKEK